jgi:hypothetical protein
MKKHSLLLLALLLIQTAFAQFNSGYVHKNNVIVIHGTDTLLNPWSGGLNNPQFSPIDINLDGFDDIFIFEKDGYKRKTFVYNPLKETYQWDSVSHNRFPKPEGGFMLMRDYNADGKFDIFTQPNNAAGINVFKNTSDTILNFVQTGKNLLYRRPGASSLYFFVQYNDLPSIDDMDGDGDVDVMFQTSGGVLANSNVLFYIQNMSMETYGVPDSLVYTLKNECWGAISEYVVDIGWTNIDCSDTADSGDGLENRGGERHGSTTLTTLDLNGDGNLDVLVGDSYVGSMLSLIGDNNNLSTEVNLTQSDLSFPSYDTPINTPSLAGAYFFDVDHDGVKDLLVAPNQPTYLQAEPDTSLNVNVDWYYKNNGSNNSPEFNLQKKGFLGADMIDVGSRSFPTLVDLNGDGLKDLVVGNEGFKIYGGTSSASLTYYKNMGTNGEPAYELIDKDFAEVSQYGFGFAHPAFADLDADGDQDMMIGDDQGMLHYFRNVGSAAFPQLLLVEPEFRGIDVDLGAHPQFFDLSTDGIPDLIVGDYYGRLQYFENSGTAQVSDFSPTPSIQKLGGLLLYNSFGGEATPYFTRATDSTGMLYAFVGTKNGTVLAYGPISNIFSPMVAIDSIEVEATYTSVTGANLSGDLRDELIIGQRTGGLYYLKRDKDVILGIEQSEAAIEKQLKVFPNPSDRDINILLEQVKNDSKAEINLYDLSGKMLLQKTATTSNGVLNTTFSLSGFPAGMYLLTVKVNDTIYRNSIIKQ